MDFKKISLQATTFAQIMNGREKMDTETLCEKYKGKPITIDGIECCEIEEELVWVYTVREEPDYFMFAGFVLTKMFNSWLEACGGDFDELYAEYDGSVSIYLQQGKTKNGRDITKVVVA